ncbi:hypothetical protein [Anaerosporobacter faecicola]|uniref:hypothetical protein n=1 Tax=Anaerosporobacter faecicola TaxID=2718714 RepID=UPI001439868C|nr:hypothetical protein [Anaerosporobacter faecicola]
MRITECVVWNTILRTGYITNKTDSFQSVWTDELQKKSLSSKDAIVVMKKDYYEQGDSIFDSLKEQTLNYNRSGYRANLNNVLSYEWNQVKQTTNGIDGEKTNQSEKCSGSDKAEKAEKTESNIVVKPDGSRVLVITTYVCGMVTTMSLELSKATEFVNDNNDKMPGDTETWNQSIESGMEIQ